MYLSIPAAGIIGWHVKGENLGFKRDRRLVRDRR